MFIRKSDKKEELSQFNQYLNWVFCDMCGEQNYDVLLSSSFTMKSFVSDKSESFKYAAPDTSKGNIVRCQRCRLVYQNPRDNDITRIYERVGEDKFYLASQSDRVATSERDAEKMEMAIGKANGRKLLDVGCSYGFFMDVVARRGWDVYGTELSEYQRNIALKNQKNICGKELKDCGYSENSFDVLTMFDVIEHLESPTAFMKDAYRVIKPGGYFVACTPNINSWPAKFFGKYWLNYARMHLYYFDPKSITVLLEKSGFKVMKIEKHKRVIQPINAIGWMQKHVWIYKILKILIGKTFLGRLKLTSGLSGNMVVYAQKI